MRHADDAQSYETWLLNVAVFVSNTSHLTFHDFRRLPCHSNARFGFPFKDWSGRQVVCASRTCFLAEDDDDGRCYGSCKGQEKQE